MQNMKLHRFNILCISAVARLLRCFYRETCRLLHGKQVTNNCEDNAFFLLKSLSVKKWCCIVKVNVRKVVPSDTLFTILNKNI